VIKDWQMKQIPPDRHNLGEIFLKKFKQLSTLATLLINFSPEDLINIDTETRFLQQNI
jgi:hypothetical protein